MKTESSFKRQAYINGKIYTVNEKQPLAQAVVTDGNKILFVGSNKEAQYLINNSTTVIDLQGKLMLPGFIDNHVHFITGGFQLLSINLRNAQSTIEFKNILKKYVSENPGKWITGGDWNHESWEIKELPTKEWIDDFTLNVPVFINRLDAHMGLANSCALKIAGINKDTPNPDGGMIVKDFITGEPTGILKDNAMKLMQTVIPPSTEKETEAALIAALNEARKNGFTSIQDISFSNELRLYQKFEKENKLTCRIYTRLPIEESSSLIKLGLQNGFGNSKIKIGALKAFADGSLGSGTALFFEPYEGEPSNFGLAMDTVTNGKLKRWSLDADKNKLQLSIHAIGDKANSIILDLFEEIVKTNPIWDRRFRIEHAQHVLPEDIKRFAENNVIASVQPYHAIDDGCWAEKKIGIKRTNYTYSFKSFLDNGVRVCFGSDWNVAPLNALLGIYASVTRRTLDGKNPDGWISEQKISVEEAIKCYTINNAYASFEEEVKGSIGEGKLADLVVLSDDILTIDPQEIKNTRVEMTIFDGEIIYNDNEDN